MQSFQHCTPHSAGTYRRRVPASTNLAVALAFARTGIPVFPCDLRKRPMTLRGHHDATTDLDTLRQWWTRWPTALVGIPTGRGSGVWVLDVDGDAGRRSLNALMARLGVATIADLTPCVSRTPSGGYHLIFRLRAGERPRNRAGDIGAGLDTRGVKSDGTSAGYFIAPGSILPDGRCYQAIDAANMGPTDTFDPSLAHAHSAPRGLLYLETFSAAERAVIRSQPDLRETIRKAEPSDWLEHLRRHQAAHRAVLAERMAGLPQDARGMRAQALYDLHEGARAYAALQNDRRNSLFRLAAKTARYVTHGVLTNAEVRSVLLAAATANGALEKHGHRWADCCITRALALGRADPLPLLARRFRTEVAA